jgi:UDP-N-acetylmuramoyl-tripeptide--D-alanyl-D-alanine ligase
LEFLGSVENVAREKLSAWSHVQPNAKLIVNADDSILMAEAEKISTSLVTFGMKAEATFSPDQIESDSKDMTVVSIEGNRFRLPLFGEYQISNLLAAYAVVRELGYSFDAIDTETIELLSTGMRGERVEVAGMTFISDCYNANPESIKAGLASFDSLPGGKRRVVILGDMLELGEASARYHSEIGEQVTHHRFDLLVAVGPAAKDIVNTAHETGVSCRRLLHYDNSDACAAEMVQILQPGDLIYLKGSRGIGLETILNRIANQRGMV